MMRKILYGLLFIGILLLLGGGFMFLWNAILPKIAHVSHINYWQALGLLVLGRQLFGKIHFGGMMGGGLAGGPPRHLKDKLISLDEDDKAAFKEEWRKRCERRGQS
jgi:hypothetical protein